MMLEKNLLSVAISQQGMAMKKIVAAKRFMATLIKEITNTLVHKFELNDFKVTKNKQMLTDSSYK